ncbi:hypothetical protein E1B28_005883 [Marasmius oreades]|uniref:Uncharacterized protein n=1 Tax=Marasmius oreades TaxID=181124 RepID=A0A9P7S421_9AGAR|nr:uncharacterized protein E1B28_005883 [Marasmius oreades]KAG7095096.1 hypothetical protein E1B28_005883 [Marasmius oreades]
MLKPRIQLTRVSSSTPHFVSISRAPSRLQRNPAFEAPIRPQKHNFSSELGLRRDLPPDSSNTTGDPSDPPEHNNNDKGPEVSDQEWEMRTGRAIDILTNTLPDFFNIGLLTSINKSTGEPQPTSSIHIRAVNASPLDYRTRNESMESIYSPKVQLSYTPPVELPVPFPKTLKIEGLPLYIASSAFVRHTLNALYSGLTITIHKVSVNTPKLSSSSYQEELPPSPSFPPDKTPSRKNREKNLSISLRVTGTARVSGSLGEWEVNCTYGFSPATGLIYMHTINSIEPAPHLTVYDAIRVSLGGVFGHGYRLPEASERMKRHGPETAFSGRPELQARSAENRGHLAR